MLNIKTLLDLLVLIIFTSGTYSNYRTNSGNSNIVPRDEIIVNPIIVLAS